MTEENTSDLVGTPPGALPEELGGSAALVGNRESEGGLPDAAKAIDPKPEEVPQDPAVTPAKKAPAKKAARHRHT